jgi:pimeloyl-ACP methyl ester carboxylesterase
MHERPPAASPETLLCLHSSGSSSRQWQRLALSVHSRFRVEAPALVGYDDGLAWSGTLPHSLIREVEHIAPVLLGASRPVHLVGHSFGAAVAVAAALRYPGRVASLVVYEPVLFCLLAEDLEGGSALAEIELVRGQIRSRLHAEDPAGAARIFVDYWSGSGAWARMGASHQALVAERMPKVGIEFDAIFSASIAASTLARLHVPTLCMYGAQTRAPMRRIAQLVGANTPNVTLVGMPGLDHMGPIAQPEPVNMEIERFLLARPRPHLPTAPCSALAAATLRCG